MPKPARAKTIALFVPDLGGGGAERVVLAEARDLIRQGHKVDLLLAFAGGELLALLPPQVRVIEFKARRLSAALRPLREYLRRENPDALHATMWPSTVIAIAAHRLARSGARLMVSDQVALSQQVTTFRQRAALRLSTALLYPLADIRVQCSAVAADDLAQLSGIARNRIEVITNPVEPPESLKSNARIEALWQVPKGERIINVGRLKDQKNQANLLRAFARLKRPKARLMILGEGELRAALEELAGELGIAERTIFAGFDIDQWPYLAAADLFVLSSDYEGFPLVLAEAMAAGLKVVSTDCPSGPVELLDGGRFGRLVPCRDPQALADAIDAALDEVGDPERMKARARALAGPAQIERYTALLTN
ncbi:MAG: glycosyltransferase [Pseudomonadota bacterium]